MLHFSVSATTGQWDDTGCAEASEGAASEPPTV